VNGSFELTNHRFIYVVPVFKELNVLILVVLLNGISIVQKLVTVQMGWLVTSKQASVRNQSVRLDGAEVFVTKVRILLTLKLLFFIDIDECEGSTVLCPIEQPDCVNTPGL
jgi:hypothetical protein